MLPSRDEYKKIVLDAQEFYRGLVSSEVTLGEAAKKFETIGNLFISMAESMPCSCKGGYDCSSCGFHAYPDDHPRCDFCSKPKCKLCDGTGRMYGGAIK